MKKSCYYIISTLIIALFFSFKVEAATSTVSAGTTINNGNNANVSTQSYSNLSGTVNEIVEDPNGILAQYVTYSPTWNVTINNMNQQYLNGFMTIIVNISRDSLLDKVSYNYTRDETDDGLKVYVGTITDTSFTLYVFFDNYYNRSGLSDLGQMNITYVDRSVAVSANMTPPTANFTTTISINQTSIWKTQLENNRLTGLLYNAIYQSTGPELENILTALTNIRNQDQLYYSQLITSLASINQNINTTNADLLLILQELDTDFNQVQTVLDLFPSYRTQVLQYWQQLLEMNAAQSQAASEAASVAADKDSQSQNLLNGMGSVQMPSLAAADLDILSGIDATQKTNFFGLIGLITHTEIITKIILIIVMGAIVGYILYGKKG